MKQRSLIAASLVLALSMASMACGEKADISIATYTWVGYGPFYLAEHLELFENEGITVELRKIDNTNVRRTALSTRSVDASVNTIDSFVNARAAGTPMKVVLKLDDSLGGDGVLVRQEIQSVTDLVGREVAFPWGEPSHFLLASVLAEHGLGMSDIKRTEMEAGDAGSAFNAGRVDAAVTWEPWLSRASKRAHGRLLVSTREMPVIVDVLTVRSDYLKEHPEVVEAVTRAWFGAIEFWKANRDEAVAIMAEAMDIPLEEFEVGVRGLAYSDLAANRAFFAPRADGSSAYEDLVQQANSIWLAGEVIEQAIDPAESDGSSWVLAQEARGN